MNRITDYLTKARQQILATFDEPKDVRLEEFKLRDNNIVVSFLLPNRNPKDVFSIGLGDEKRYERVYKKITFDSGGEVSDVEIYNP